MIKRLSLYLQEVKREFKRVNWPTRKEATRYTLIVIGMSLAAAIFLGAFDFLFTYLLERFLL